jgi:formiminotetrahydrofolate cyclodeaminase
MKFKDFTIDDYTKALASDFPTPGGGTTAALAAALGSSFIAMVAKITINKGEFPEQRNKLEKIITAAERLRLEFMQYMDNDTKAYNKILTLNNMFKEGKITETVFLSKKQEALKECIKQPFLILETCKKAISLAKVLSNNYYKATSSDLSLAAKLINTSSFGVYNTILSNKNRILDVRYMSFFIHKSNIMYKSIETISLVVYNNTNINPVKIS